MRSKSGCPTVARSVSVPRLAPTLAVAFAVLAALGASSAAAQTVARCGEGWLELIHGYPVLHLKGTHYEMGYQHGALMKQGIQKNFERIIQVEAEKPLVTVGPVALKPRFVIGTILEMQKPHVPKKYFDELEGLAAGSEMKLGDVRLGNFIPELFHCSGFALMNSATKDGTLYHGRVLDYAIHWGLQEHPVLIVAEPQDGIPFVNVSYAGFIGSVTGMNAKHVSIGEMGGRGAGKWDGMPMALLVREALENAGDLDAAIRIFKETQRTCQYYYVIADGNTNRAVGMEASADRFEVIQPGTSHPLLPTAVKDCALLSAGDRYKELVRRAQEGHGTFTAETALRLMDRPVSMSSNLHNVLFEPKSTKLWVANASKDKIPAADRPYQAFQLSELLKRKPDPESPVLPLIVQEVVADGKPRVVCHPVSGVATLNGLPAVNAEVAFHSTRGEYKAMGFTKADGSFALTTFEANDGAPEGAYIVTISSREETGDDARIPQKYTEVETSKLRISVKRGENSINFDLKK